MFSPFFIYFRRCTLSHNWPSRSPLPHCCILLAVHTTLETLHHPDVPRCQKPWTYANRPSFIPVSNFLSYLWYWYEQGALFAMGLSCNPVSTIQPFPVYQHCFQPLWSLTCSIWVGGCWTCQLANIRTHSYKTSICRGLKSQHSQCLVLICPFLQDWVVLWLLCSSTSLQTNLGNQIHFLRKHATFIESSWQPPFGPSFAPIQAGTEPYCATQQPGQSKRFP